MVKIACGSDDDEFLLADSCGFFCWGGAAASPKSDFPCSSAKREPRRFCLSRKRPDLEVVILRVKPPAAGCVAPLGLSGAAAACCCWVVLLICLSSR